MPFKICPNTSCQKPNGPRTLYCHFCQAPFEKTLKKFGHAVPAKQSVVVNSVPSLRSAIAPKVDPKSPINLDPTGYFDCLYDREAQINILISGFKTAVESNFKIRTHAIMHGSSASGKTTLMDCFSNMVGEDICYRIDATTSTQAGILSDLMERASAIRVLLIDELEKANPDNFRFLLGLMDERGELRICNAKAGSLQCKMPAFVIATTNDLPKVESLMSGALYSRFSDRIYCPRVDENTIYKAVKKYVDMIGGDERWIRPAINHVRTMEKTEDIRRMIAVAVNGRERLLSGEYQEILRSTNKF